MAPIYIIHGVEYGRVGNRTRINPRLIFEPSPPEMQIPADIIAKKIAETFGVSN